MLIRYSFLIFLGSLLFSCTSPSDKNLQEYTSSFEAVKDNLVSCAASDPSNDNASIVFYKTIAGANNLRFWHSETYSEDLLDYTILDQLVADDLFNGFMGKYDTSIGNGSVILSLEKGDTLIYCKPIEILSKDQEALRDNDINIDQSDILNPSFDWPESTIDPSSIYFHLIVDSDDNEAISGTYSYENTFTFYMLDNVVFNVTEKSDPQLFVDKNYEITLMQVSDNNWVTKISTKVFSTF